MLGAEQKKWAWLFIGLLGVGFSSLAVAFFPASSTAVSSPNELQPSAYLDMFTWLNSGAGTALAFKGDEILYQLLSKEPPTFQDPVRDTLNNISNVTHIRTVQQTNPFLQYGFRVLIGDGLLDALKAGNRDYIFYSAGLSPRQLDNARKVLLSKGVCFI